MDVMSKEVKRPPKNVREREVLLGLIDHYISNGKPVGSHSLKEEGFDHLSAATIRNYFTSLEEEGYLYQPHTSGGRIPTSKAFRLYAEAYADKGLMEAPILERIKSIKKDDTREVQSLIQKTLEELSELTGTAAFISSPRFDRDFVVDAKIVPIDAARVLCVLITDFGAIHSELVAVPVKVSQHLAKKIESYFQHRIRGLSPFESPLDAEEEKLAQLLYSEGMVRFLVGYSNFSEEDLLRAGFSKMLQYPEFRDLTVLTESMALFESNKSLRHLLHETQARNSLVFWIGEDLVSYGAQSSQTSVIAIPYSIQHQTIGALGIIGPLRIPYRKFFAILHSVKEALSEALTHNLYKYKLSYRLPFDRLRIESLEASTKEIGYQPIKMIEPRTPK